jgi:hypothetical protein
MPEKKSSGMEDVKPAAAQPPAATPCDPPPAAPVAGGAAPPTGARRPAPARPAVADLYLGHARAVTIVCTSAKTIPANLPRTLEELGVNGIPFQQAIRTAVKAAGYTLGPEDVPGAPGTRLIQVVTIIQNARRTA